MAYPGHVIGPGETDRDIVRHIVQRLVEKGSLVDPAQDTYDLTLTSYVKLFQSHRYDALGRALKADGRVGPLTWGALFGVERNEHVPGGLGGDALNFAVQEIGTMEVPEESNCGPRVEQYQASVGLPSGTFWCMAFVHFCFQEAASGRGTANPFPHTGGVLEAWRRAKASHPSCILPADDARADPGLVRPGMVFILDHGGGLGHTGFVRSVAGGAFRTVEGNSNPDGSSNGIGVFDINRRKVTSEELKGFIDFTTA